MPSTFSVLDLLGPAGLIFQALLTSLVAVLGCLAFILLRRGLRRLYFRQRDRRILEVRSRWDKIVSGQTPASSWMPDLLTREVVEGILLDKLEVSLPFEAEKLRDCLRSSGLLDTRAFQARYWKGWRRHQALLVLGRMQMPEAIPALAEGLDDAAEDSRMAAVRGLGRLELPSAAVPILERLSRGRLAVPASLIQDALINNCRTMPHLVLRYLSGSEAEARPLLTRVLAEIATPDLSDAISLLASDEAAEVRASAARALASAKPGFALSILAGLANDEEWFVRLRAVVALGELEDPRSIPILLDSLNDRNRQVRIRAACGLSRLKGHEEDILCRAMKTQDPYAVEELVSELERSGGIFELVTALADARRRPMTETALMMAVKSGCRRILLDLVLHHESWRVRGALARLLARSGDPALHGLIDLFDSPHLPARKRRVLHWLRSELAQVPPDTSQAARVVA